MEEDTRSQRFSTKHFLVASNVGNDLTCPSHGTDPVCSRDRDALRELVDREAEIVESMGGGPGAGPPVLRFTGASGLLRDPGTGKPIVEGAAIAAGPDVAGLAQQQHSGVGASEAGAAVMMRPPEPQQATQWHDTAAARAGSTSGANGGSRAMRYLLMGQSVMRAMLNATLVEPPL